VVEPPGPRPTSTPAPEGRQTRCGLSPLRGWKDFLTISGGSTTG